MKIRTIPRLVRLVLPCGRESIEPIGSAIDYGRNIDGRALVYPLGWEESIPLPESFYLG